MRRDRPPVVLDVRWSFGVDARPDDYSTGHIPGAVFVDLDKELADRPGPDGRHPLPELGRFVEIMRQAGIADDSSVVCYDAGVGASAARAWWLLRQAGLADVRVLGGGLAAWRRAGHKLADGTQPAPPGTLTVRAPLVEVIETDQVLPFIENGVLLDARAEARFLGSEPIDAVGGHIPGEINLPTSANVDTDGRFIGPDAVRARLAALGVPGSGTPLAVYCGSGVTATHALLALASAGIAAALYPGSWSAWISAGHRPVARGER
jgi:thiosulfate/3-mercaptopyruvate sulfurtransferase